MHKPIVINAKQIRSEFRRAEADAIAAQTI